MGYRSQVAIAIRNSKRDDFISRLSEESKNLLGLVDAHHEGQDATLYYFEWVKWYDGEEIEGLIGNEFSEDAFFLRLGEEDGDMEERGTWWGGGEFEISYTRHLTFSGAPTP